MTLLSLAEHEKADEKEVVSGSASNMPMGCDIAECFFWLPFFSPQGNDSCLISPTGLHNYLLLYSKILLITWEKDGFCDLACTFCPSANGIHYQKQTLMGALGITWQLHSQAIWVYTSIYLWIPCAHLPLRTDLDQTDLDQSNHLMGGLCGWQGYQDSTAYVVWICLSKYMFNSNWFF